MHSPYPGIDAAQELISRAKHILIIQADNPDADSLGSALALEQILGEMGKDISLYCAVDMPAYLRYLSGWDRVSKDLPGAFDLSIIVDASTMTLLDKFQNPRILKMFMAKQTIILDHHAITDNPIPFATVEINDGNLASTGQLIYHISKSLNWPLDTTSGEFIMNTILGDTQGLTNELATANTYRIMADLIDMGVSRPKLEETRREYSKMPESILRYKAELITRAELYDDGKIALVTVPQHEINEHSPLYNPAPLIQTDLLQTIGVQVAIVLKSYDSGRITAAIRANNGYSVAGKIAEHFGGGGHNYASGFKLEDGRPLHEVKSECISVASDLLSAAKQD